MMSSKLIDVEQWVGTFSDFVALDDEALKSFSIFDALDYLEVKKDGVHTHDQVTFDRVLYAELPLTKTLLIECYSWPTKIRGRVICFLVIHLNQQFLTCGMREIARGTQNNKFH
jgi:hypothetical protein